MCFTCLWQILTCFCHDFASGVVVRHAALAPTCRWHRLPLRRSGPSRHCAKQCHALALCTRWICPRPHWEGVALPLNSLKKRSWIHTYVIRCIYIYTYNIIITVYSCLIDVIVLLVIDNHHSYLFDYEYDYSSSSSFLNDQLLLLLSFLFFVARFYDVLWILSGILGHLSDWKRLAVQMLEGGRGSDACCHDSTSIQLGMSRLSCHSAYLSGVCGNGLWGSK